MKHKRLQVYLHDHLAGAALAIDLLKRLSAHRREDGLDTFAAELLIDIREDHEELKKLSSRIESRSAGFKEMVARLLEKLSRLKFHRSIHGSFGVFEALEALSLGILGKEALWTALASLRDPRLDGIDYAALIGRARDQRARVEERRLRMASLALTDA